MIRPAAAVFLTCSTARHACSHVAALRAAVEARAKAREPGTAADTALEFAARLGLRPLATPTAEATRRSTLVDDLVLEYASPRTQRLLREYEAQTQVRPSCGVQHMQCRVGGE